MKNIKKYFIFFIMFGIISLFSNIKLSALDISTTEDIQVEGAQIRTVEPNGLAFVVKIDNVESYQGATEYGVLLSRGVVEGDDLNDFTIGSTINGYSTVNGAVDSLDENKFRVSLINIPTDFYNLEYSARAYIKVDSNYIYSQEIITRSYYEVAKAELDGGSDNPLIINICTTRVKYFLESGKLIYSDLTQQLLDEYNAFTAKSFTKEDFFNLGSYDEIGNMSIFLYSDIYRENWRWLTNYIKTIAGTNNKNAWNAFNNYNSQDELYAASNNYIYSIAYEMRAFIGGGQYTKNANYHTADYSSVSIQNGALELSQNFTFIYQKDTSTLPSPTKYGTYFGGWYDNPELSGTKINSLSKNSGFLKLYAKYVETEYVQVEADFNLNGGIWSKTALSQYATKSNVIANTFNAFHVFGYRVGLYDKSAPKPNLEYWNYFALKETTNPNVYEIYKKGTATLTAPDDYDYLIVYHDQGLKDETSGIPTYQTFLKTLLDNGSTIGKLVTLEGTIPGSGTSSAEITINFFSADEQTKIINTTFLMPGEGLPIPYRAGYVFVGWLCDKDSQIYNSYPAYTNNPGKITYTAQWEEQ